MDNTDTDNMGEIMTDTDKKTLRQWAAITGKNPDSVARTYRRKHGQGVSVNSLFTADEWRQILEGSLSVPVSVSAMKKNTSSGVLPKPAGSQVDSPATLAKKKPLQTGWHFSLSAFLSSIRRPLLDIILIGIVLGHALLIWYDCATLWDTPGHYAGALAFAVITAAVMLATDPTKNITSQYALLFALVVDAGAFWVHYPVFSEYDAPEGVTAALCVFLCAMSWGSLFLYRHQKNN